MNSDRFRKGAEKYPWLAKIAMATIHHGNQFNEFQLLQPLSSHLTGWVDLTMQAAEQGIKKADRKNPNDEFNVFAINSSRWCSLFHSIVMNAQQGSYGECSVLGRSLMELTDLVLVLGSHPEKIEDWVATTGRNDQRIPNRWMPGGLRKQVQNLTDAPYPRELYSEMSSAIHPSYYGASHFANRVPGVSNAYVSTPEPMFDPLRLMDALYIPIRMAPLPLWQFMKITVRRNFPKKLQESFIARYQNLEDEMRFIVSYSGGLKELITEFSPDSPVSWTKLVNSAEFKSELGRREIEWRDRVIADFERD